MAKTVNKLSTQGHRVMGALATFLAPKLAEDQTLQATELESVCKSIVPARYDKQIDGIIGTVNERFGKRLAQDQKLDDLRKVLLALSPLELAQDDNEAEDEDDDSNDDSNDGLPPALRKNAEKMKEKMQEAKDKKKAKDKKEDDASEEDEDDAESGDESEEDEVKAKDKKAKDKACAKDEQAHDAAITKLASDATMQRLQSLYEAAAAVKPVVGEVNVLACDSAADIYAMALKAKKVDYSAMPKSSLKHVFNALMVAEDAKAKPAPRFGQDTAITKTLSEKYPNMPALG